MEKPRDEELFCDIPARGDDDVYLTEAQNWIRDRDISESRSLLYTKSPPTEPIEGDWFLIDFAVDQSTTPPSTTSASGSADSP
jgi:hypothetical protein